MAKADLYGHAQIVVGDTTSHGGVVLSGSPTSHWYGIAIARKHDRVWCPLCAPHLFEIAEGFENCTDGDAALPMAAEGHRTTCGATLIARGSGMGAVKANAIADAIFNGKGFDEQARLAHEAIEGLPYFIRTRDGVVHSGRVGLDQLLPRVFTHGEGGYELYWGDEALAEMGSNA